jgi:hypothetical protein
MPTFKEYYDTDPEFKKNHLQYMSERITCECGLTSSRNNLPRHRKGARHAKEMKKHLSKDELLEMKKKIDEAIKKLIA